MEIKEASTYDYDSLVEFWNQNSGWDHIDKSVWEDRFINCPYGPSVIFFIVSKGKILANLIYVRIKAHLGEEEYSGCRPFAAVVDKSIKGIFGIKYIIQLLNHGFKSMRNKNIDLLIMLPDPRWKRPLQLIDVVLWEFPLFMLPITQSGISTRDVHISTKKIDFDHEGIGELWSKLKKQCIYMVSRNPQILKWKNSHRDYKLIGVFEGNILISVATYLEKPKEHQIQICDVLIPDFEKQELVFSHISNFINGEYNNDQIFNKMVILVPDFFKESLLKVGYEPDNYKFLFAIKRLNKKLISKQTLNISNWYLSAND